MNPDTIVTKSLIKQLYGAAQNGQVTAVKALLEKDIDVDLGDEDGSTALIFAAYRGQTEVVRLLIDAGADVNKGNARGYTALMVAARECYASTVVLLLLTFS